MLSFMKVNVTSLALGVVFAMAGGSAGAVTYTYSGSTVCATSLTIETSGAITCAATGTSNPPFYFPSALNCSAGLSIKAPGTTGSSAVECATTLPVCTLSASPSTVTAGGSSTLTASCSPAATSYSWIGGTCTTATTASCTVTPATTTSYSVTGRNTGGAGTTVSAQVRAAIAGQSGPYAYIAHQGSAPTASAPGGILSVIDTPTNTAVASVNVGAYPVGVAVNSTGSRVYVSNLGSNTVSVIDTSATDPKNFKVVSDIVDSKTGISGNAIPVGLAPFGVAANPKGQRLYVANSGTSTVSVIDTSTNQAISTVSVGNNPHGVAVNPAGTKVYVTNYGSSTASVIDASSNTVIATVQVGGGAYGVAVNPDGTRAYVTNEGNATVSVINTSSNTVVATVNVGLSPHGVAVNPSGTQVYVVNTDSRTISVIDTATNIVTATLNAAVNSLGSLVYNIAFVPDGTSAYIINRGDNTLSMIDTVSNIVTATVRNFASNGPYSLGQFIGPVIVPATTYQDLWWNPNESGWGMSITQHSSMIFAALYTYDPSGQPAWYVMSSCPVSANSCTGDIYHVSGGTSPTVPWNGTGKAVAKAGSGTLTFTDANNGTFNYTLNGVSSSRTITRQVFATGATPPAVDYTDLWWNANESGWGVALSQQYGTIFAAWYTYDATGKAIWYVASSCPVVGSGCIGDLYQVTGGTPVTSAWNGSSKVVTKVGSVTFAFTDANNGSILYVINGISGYKTITRQGF